MQFLINRKFLFKLIVAVCVVLTIFNFIMSTKVNAEDNFIVSIGGKLLEPLVSLVVALGDGCVGILHNVIMGENISNIVIDTSTGWISIIIGIVVGTVVVAGLIALTIATAGAGTAIVGAVIGAMGSIVVTAGVTGLAAGVIAYCVIDGNSLPEVTLLPLYSIGPQEIFEGKILLFDVNIFNPKEIYVDIDGNYQKLSEWKNNGNTDTTVIDRYVFFKDGNPSNTSAENIVITSNSNAAYELKNSIAEWYYTIRNIALIAFVLVLLYVGIKIAISSTASEKSKYKEMFKDWLVGICLLFIIHYIMIFAVNITEKVTNLLSSSMGEIYTLVKINDANPKLIEKLKEQGFGSAIEGNNISWGTNLMGKIRIESQLKDGFNFIGYSLCYLVLVIYTITFTFTYLKRLLYIVFLVIIAPLIAVTYPIDKIRDGKAQGFDIWFKEFIFNLIIQPFHLLMYFVLVGMAVDLANSNILYSIVAIGFMIPAEKLLRKMFGFEKASTPGFLSGAAGAAATMSGIQALGKFASKGFGGKSSSKETGKTKENDKINFQDDRGIDSKHSKSDLYSNFAQEYQTENMNSQNDNEKNTTNDMNQKESEKNTYFDDGFNQNANGEYFNPYTDEYDPEYNPFKEENDSDEQNNLDNNIDLENNNSENKDQKANTDVEDNSEDNDKNEKRQIRNRAIKYYGKSIGKGLVKGAGFVSRKGMALSLGAIGGTIGLASGIATGSPSSALKNTTAGAIAGGAIGTGISKNTVFDMKDEIINKGQNSYNKAAKEIYGEKYGEIMRKRSDDKFRKDKELRKMYAEKLKLKKKEEIDKAMDDAVKYREWGVTDNDTIIRAMKIEDKKDKNRASTKRIAAARLATASKTEKELETNMKAFGKTKGITKEQTEEMEAMVRQINYKDL